MKTVNTNNLNENVTPQTDANVSIEFSMPVYNELHDQTQSSVNVIALINDQFKQIYEMNKRRSLLLNEVSTYIVK